MSGHSKWSNIKNRKAAVDAKKAKVFSEISKKIRIAVKDSGSGDPNSNSSLRLLLDKARVANMPNKKIQKAIDCGLGKGANGQIKEIIYEAFGPGGVGMLIVVFTDNANRTSSELRNMLGKSGGSMGGPGSAMYMFNRVGDGSFKAAIKISVDDETTKSSLSQLINDLLEHSDVEDVYSTANLQ